jgi:uncharacterized protein with ATP-grasp and redox domains
VNLKDLINCPPINGLPDNSFAAFTIRNRLPYIINGVIRDNAYSIGIEESLNELKQSILHGKLDIPLISGTDINEWNNWLKPFRNMSWFEAPFYFIEAYFYRIIMDKIGFFTHGIDPFGRQKKQDIQENITHFMTLLSNFEKHHVQTKDSIKFLLNQCLWGNKSDLSQLSIPRQGNSILTDHHTLIDDSDAVANYLNTGVNRIDIVLDNSGVELFTDIIQAVHLLESQKVEQVHLHTKAYPTFVSDTTSSDITLLLDALKNDGNSLLCDFADTVGDLCNTDKLIITSDIFWNSPLHFYEMSEDIRNELRKSDLIIFKGDANYRRIFGDRQIPYDQKLSSITDYLPAKSIGIRILKSEIMLGMETDAVTSLFRTEKDWLVNGKYGMIQMLN